MSIWRRPALWWRVGIVLAAYLGLTFNQSSLVYFTVQSNLIAMTYFAGCVYWMIQRRDPAPAAPRLRGAVTLWVMITGLVAHILLNHGANPLPGLISGGDVLHNWATFAVHYIVPAMALLDWVLFPPHRVVPLSDLVLWLLFPLGYAFVALGRAAVHPDFVTPYPYYFLDPTGRGYGWVFGQFLVLTVEFAVLGSILLGVDRLAARLRRSGRPATAPPPHDPVSANEPVSVDGPVSTDGDIDHISVLAGVVVALRRCTSRRVPLFCPRSRLGCLHLPVLWRSRGDQLAEQVGGGCRDGRHRPIERGLIGLRRSRRPGDLPHILQRGGMDLVGGGRWLEVVQLVDVAAHVWTLPCG